MPVIIWIHGGAFCIGSADYRAYGPDYILEHDIVMVGINYRLGPLGFFCLENDAAPGNLGMHDQVAAMKWVKNHIVNFGGDPANVTLMGESAGAMSIFLHLVSPLSKGLFHKVSSNIKNRVASIRLPRISHSLNRRSWLCQAAGQLRSSRVTDGPKSTHENMQRSWELQNLKRQMRKLY